MVEMTDSNEAQMSISSLLSISHDKDVDGLTSAAIAKRYADTKGIAYDVLLTDYGSFQQVFSSVATRRNTLIVITDLGMDEPSLDFVMNSLQIAVGQGCRIVWLDHHHWGEKSIKAVLALGNKPVLKINHDFCAAEIAHKVLMPRDDICAELARIAHDTDFNLREIESASSLTDALSIIRFTTMDKKEDLTDVLKPILFKLAEHGMAGIWDESTLRFKDSLLDQRVKHYRKEKTKKMKKALEGHCDQEVHGRLVRIVEIPHGVTTTDLGTFLSDESNLKVDGSSLPVADLLVTLSQGGMLGFRRGRDTVLCNAAAKLFDGGGHPYAAGGEYGSYEKFDAVCDDILLTLSKDKTWVVE